MVENSPKPKGSILSNRERVERAEQSTQNSFDQYKGSKSTDRWMWIAGIAVVIIAVIAAVFAWRYAASEPEAQPVVDRETVRVDESAPVEKLNGGFVGTFAGEFNAGEDNTWEGIISFAGETAVLVYPTTGCQALLTLVSPESADKGDTENDSATTYDTQALNRKCVTDGFWEFESDSGLIEARYFEANDAGEPELKAAARLSRDTSAMIDDPAE